nr:ferredoxin [Streptantibioticus ferralitis]
MCSAGAVDAPRRSCCPPPHQAPGRRLAVDWTLCEGHGLCADVPPEAVRLDPDGFRCSSTDRYPGT